jgi:cytochrome P450
MIEELLRINAVVANTGRIASEDIVYKNILFPKGTIAFINLSSANMDESVFNNAETFNTLNEEQHFAFGGGLHKCIGAALARAEIQVALGIIAERIPNIALAGEVVNSPENHPVYGPISIPIKIVE